MGKKTSVYLTDEVEARVEASGKTPAELIRRGLDAGDAEGLEAIVERAVRNGIERPAMELTESTAHAAARIEHARQMIPDSDPEALEALTKAVTFRGPAGIAPTTGGGPAAEPAPAGGSPASRGWG